MGGEEAIRVAGIGCWVLGIGLFLLSFIFPIRSQISIQLFLANSEWLLSAFELLGY